MCGIFAAILNGVNLILVEAERVYRHKFPLWPYGKSYIHGKE
jgi:hypothetical protein